MAIADLTEALATEEVDLLLTLMCNPGINLLGLICLITLLTCRCQLWLRCLLYRCCLRSLVLIRSKKWPITTWKRRMFIGHLLLLHDCMAKGIVWGSRPRT